MLSKRFAGGTRSELGWLDLRIFSRRMLSVFALALAGCTENGAPGVRPLKAMDIITVPYARFTGESLTGSLAYEGDCLLFVDDNSSRRILPVWPSGSVFNGTSLVFHAPGKSDQPIVIAQHFAITGRTMSWSDFPPVYYGRFQQKCGGEPFRVGEVRPAE